MFESITIFNQNKTSVSTPLDIGALVECMLFYGNTTIVANQSTLKQLFRYFGIDGIIELINEDLLQIIYTETFLGIHTKTINKLEYHDFIAATTDSMQYQTALRNICIEITDKKGKGRRIAQRIQSQDLIKVKKHENIILDGSKNSILNQEYMNNATKIILKNSIPEKIDVDNIIFHTNETENGVFVSSNIDFSALNKIYHKYIPPSHSTITHAHLLSHILDMESELYFSANNLSEIATSELGSELISHKISYIMDKSIKSKKSISDFQQFVFNDAKSLREAVNNGKVDINDLISVLKKSQKFKKWISGVESNQNLLKEYYNEVANETFLEKLTGKTARFCFFVGSAELLTHLATNSVLPNDIAKMVGLGFSVFDYFWLDRLYSGWKPNQFIENEVKKLLVSK
jgi:hypothetical protein